MDFPSNSVSPLCLSPPTYVPSTGLTWRRHIVRVCVIGYDGTSWEPRWLVSWFLIRRLTWEMSLWTACWWPLAPLRVGPLRGWLGAWMCWPEFVRQQTDVIRRPVRFPPRVRPAGWPGERDWRQLSARLSRGQSAANLNTEARRKQLLEYKQARRKWRNRRNCIRIGSSLEVRLFLRMITYSLSA